MDIVEMPREDYSNDDLAIEFLEKYKNEGISLELSDIDFKYKSGNENVFENASMYAHPHEIVALVGPSGEGKTTMLRIILSLILTSNGKASLYNGDDKEKAKEIIPLDPSSRKLLSYVPQGNTLFSGTIAYNMRSVKSDATDEEIIEALKIACAWDFVEKLPDGINSEIKERGGGFSEGQAQRIAIARAIIRKSPILLLDEATSALDVKTERKLLKNILKDEYPRTCIVTTHRPTVLTICNRVYEIKDKKLNIIDDIEIDKLIRDF
jgi:ABC-type multidrug transport system fused ATPase/permease subunit